MNSSIQKVLHSRPRSIDILIRVIPGTNDIINRLRQKYTFPSSPLPPPFWSTIDLFLRLAPKSYPTYLKACSKISAQHSSFPIRIRQPYIQTQIQKKAVGFGINTAGLLDVRGALRDEMKDVLDELKTREGPKRGVQPEMEGNFEFRPRVRVRASISMVEAQQTLNWVKGVYPEEIEAGTAVGFILRERQFRGEPLEIQERFFPFKDVDRSV